MCFRSRADRRRPSARPARAPASRAARGASAGRRGCRSRSAWPTIPRPKWCCQSRLTITRAVSGWSGRGQPLRQVEPRSSASSAAPASDARERRRHRRSSSASRRRASGRGVGGPASRPSTAHAWRRRRRQLQLRACAARPCSAARFARSVGGQRRRAPRPTCTFSSGLAAVGAASSAPAVRFFGSASTRLAASSGRASPSSRPVSFARYGASRSAICFLSGVELRSSPRSRLPLSAAFSAVGGEVDVLGLRAGEERLEAVVVALRDRVELVVVAAGAADRQAEDGRPEAVDHLGQHLLADLVRVEVAADHVDRAAAVQPGGEPQVRRRRAGPCRRRAGRRRAAR